VSFAIRQETERASGPTPVNACDGWRAGAIDLTLEIDTEKQHIALTDEAPFLDVGRSPMSHLVLCEPSTLSWRHLTIRWSDGWWVQDASTNGSSLNGVWFRGCTVALNVDDVLEIEGHVLIVHQLSEPIDGEATERKATVKQLVLRDSTVELYPSYGTITRAIPPQQYDLLCELASCWTGSDFAPLDREREFALLGAIGGDKDPTIRLHQNRARLRRWWRTLQHDCPRELQGTPADIVQVETDGLRLTLNVDSVTIEGQDLSGNSPC
jgi:hypothetical protein